MLQRDFKPVSIQACQLHHMVGDHQQAKPPISHSYKFSLDKHPLRTPKNKK